MERFFNTSGPIVGTDHYTVPLMERIDWEDIQHLIRSKRYFVLHAPRQTGKTSTLLAIMEELNKTGQYNAVYANIEGAQAARGDVHRSIPAICSVIARSVEYYTAEQSASRSVSEWIQDKGNHVPVDDMLTQLLVHWSQSTPLPCVLLLDEVDALVGDSLISLLRQLRAGYTQRPRAFPQSVVLCGVRDVRDYRMRQQDGEIITGGSAFNIKAKSLRMDNFSPKETRDLLIQHTTETGQKFAETIFPELWEDTKGQPWLVNALAHEMVWEDKTARDRSLKIDLERYFAAREALIQSRATHLDQLADKLREKRVRRVIEPLLGGERTELQMPSDDLQYVADIGLIRRKPQLEISNRIYREIIPRELISVTQDTMVQNFQWYLTHEHQLNMSKLLSAFQQFFRENSQSWIERFDYKEAGPQLLMQAFLQRIINGGGRLHREYGLGRKRTDLLIEWPMEKDLGMYGKVQRVVLELKIQRGSLETLISQAIVQTLEYADMAGAGEAHLIIFNRDAEIPWNEKIWHQKQNHGDRVIGLWGC